MKENVSLNFFINKKRRFYISANKLILGAFLTFTLIAGLIYTFFKNQVELELAAAVPIFILFIGAVLFITSAFRRKPLCGKFHKEIDFMLDKVKIPGKEYTYNDIEDVNFYIDDIEGNLDPIFFTLNARMSQGVCNYISFRHKSQKKYKLYFKVKNKKEQEEIKKVIVALMKIDKVPFLRGIEILGLYEYKEIEDFKRRNGISIAYN